MYVFMYVSTMNNNNMINLSSIFFIFSKFFMFIYFKSVTFLLTHLSVAVCWSADCLVCHKFVVGGGELLNFNAPTAALVNLGRWI